MRGAKLLQKVLTAKYPSESNLSTNLLKFGGAALVAGGLGYLWYRNSGLKVYREISNEEFCYLAIKVKHTIFPDFYRAVRKSNFDTIIKMNI